MHRPVTGWGTEPRDSREWKECEAFTATNKFKLLPPHPVPLSQDQMTLVKLLLEPRRHGSVAEHCPMN